MSNKTDVTKRFHVGRFSVSDHKSTLNITGYVEVGTNYIDTLFFLALDANKSDNYISVKMNSIEMRALANAIDAVLSSGKEYVKDGGGTGTSNKLKISSTDQYDFLGLTKGTSEPIQVSFKQYELLALSQEIRKLADEVISATYKTQQVRENKRKKLRKEQELKEKEEIGNG